jgi:hypothetical protein
VGFTHPALGDDKMKASWRSLLKAQRQLRFQYNELSREVNLRAHRLVSDSKMERLRADFLNDLEAFLNRYPGLRALVQQFEPHGKESKAGEAPSKSDTSGTEAGAHASGGRRPFQSHQGLGPAGR